MKLVLFGDSFVSIHLDETYSWPFLLAHNLNISKDDILNFGKPGTGLDWSICQFISYLNSNDYNENDIVIFVVTNHGRPPIIENENQSMSAGFGAYNNDIENIPTNVKQYYKKYDAFYRTWFDLQNDDMKYKDRWLLALALKQLPNFTILMSGFKDIVLPSQANHILLQNSDNFLKIESDLISISKNEMMNKKLGLRDFYNYFDYEPRTCHMSNSNNIVLADQLSKCIIYRNSSYFDKNSYHKNLYELSSKYNNVFEKEFNLETHREKRNVKLV